MAVLNLRKGKEFVASRANAPVDGDEQFLVFKKISSSYQEGKKPFKHRETGADQHWISFNAQVVTDGVSKVWASCFIVLTDKDGNEDGQALHKVDVIYEAWTGKQAPDEIDLDQFFLDCEDKVFVSKVFTEKVVNKDEDGKPIFIIEKGKSVPEYVDFVDEDGYKKYKFSPFAISVEEYSAKKDKELEKERQSVLEDESQWDFNVDAKPENEGMKIVNENEEKPLASQVFEDIFG